jgi:hypothetical protein
MKQGLMSTVLFAASVSLAPLVALGAPLVSPSAGSDVVLSMRATPAGELRLQYRKESGAGSTEDVSAGIANDYHYMRSAGQTRIYDFKSRRIFSVQPGDTFINDSLYAEVWYRVAELRSRVVLSGAVKGAGIATPQTLAESNDPFWIESSLGMTSPQLPHTDLRQVTEKDQTRWLRKDEEVAAVRYEKDEVPLALQGGMRRFWGTFTQMHPDLAVALAASKHIPAELWIEQRPFGKDPVMVHWTLTSQKWERAAMYPLAAHLTPHPTNTVGLYPEIFATLAAATADKRLPPPQETYAARAEDALGRGAGLEALTWVLEMGLARGPNVECGPNDPQPFCSLAARIGPAAKTDPRTALAFAPQSPDETVRPQFADLPNGYVLRLLWATRAPGKGVEPGERERDLLAALRASAVANFCKDTGDFYATGWQPFAAWQVWDLGRLMAGHKPGDLLDHVDAMEADMVSTEPAYF